MTTAVISALIILMHSLSGAMLLWGGQEYNLWYTKKVFGKSLSMFTSMSILTMNGSVGAAFVFFIETDVFSFFPILGTLTSMGIFIGISVTSIAYKLGMIAEVEDDD